MTERDAFETRFGAAVRGYVGRVSSDLDAAELAHRIAAAQPRRHGLAAALTWRRVAIPRGAWVLLLAAGLLAALVGGMLIAGSQREPKLPAVVPPIGQLFACPPGSAPDSPGPVAQSRPGGALTTSFDRRAGRLVAVVDGDDGFETWTFDVCTNTWTQMHPTWTRTNSNRKPPDLVPDLLGVGSVYDVASDLTILITDAEVYAYDLHADTWTYMGTAPGGARLGAYDPLSGLVVASGWIGEHQGLWGYNVETNTWTPVGETVPDGDPAPSGHLAYDASVDRIVAYGLDGTWLFDPRTGTWSRSSAATPLMRAGWGMSPPAVVYDETAERTMVIGWHVASYDATADRWEVQATSGTPDWVPSSMVYDPVNRRLIGPVPPSIDDGVIAGEGGVAAFDSVTREWTLLLEPAAAEATP